MDNLVIALTLILIIVIPIILKKEILSFLLNRESPQINNESIKKNL